MKDDARRTILLYGDFLSDRLAASYRRAFEHLGHNVVPLDTRETQTYLAPWISNRVGHRTTRGSLALRRAGSLRWNRHIQETARRSDPDLIFILNGEWVMPETVRALRDARHTVFIFHADNPFREHSSSRPENLACAVESDCYFIWSRAVAERLRRRGVRRVEYLPFGWDEEVFPYLDAPVFENDLVFVGGWDREREAMLEPLAAHFDVKIWGPPYWGTRTRATGAARRSWQGHALTGAQAAQVIARSQISLNILRAQNLPDGVIMRTFEVPGCGGFALSTRTSGASDIFPEGEAGAYFTGVNECIRQIEYYLSHPPERNRIAEKAHQVVSHGHRYVDRACRVLEVFAGLR